MEALAMTSKRKTIITDIGKMSNLFRRQLDAISAYDDLSGAKKRVLFFLIDRTSDTYQKDIEQEYCLRAPSASALIKDLEQDGYIRRIADPDDARLKKIAVTEKGLRQKTSVQKDLRAMEASITRGISSEDMDQFLKISEQIIRNLNEGDLHE
jgi:DNA-binding MarR family transcriptional regulator